MSNALFTAGKEGILDGSISWSNGNIKVVLIDAGAYTVNLSTHKFLSDIPTGARVATSGVLQNRTTSGGVADADDITISTVTGPSVEAAAIYEDTGSATSSRLIAYVDSAGAGLPFTPNGGDVLIQWPSGSSKIFGL